MNIIRLIFLPFILILAFIALMFLALCEWVYTLFGGKRIEERMRDWKSDQEDALAGKLKRQCKYCGYEYKDPKYCSVSGRTADKHKWI